MAENKGKIDVAAAQRFLADHFDTFENKKIQTNAPWTGTSTFRREVLETGSRPSELLAQSKIKRLTRAGRGNEFCGRRGTCLWIKFQGR